MTKDKEFYDQVRQEGPSSVKPRARSDNLVVLPETTARRCLPINLQPGEAALFSHELERNIPATQMLEIADVFASAEGILFKRGRMLPQSFAFTFNRDNWKTRSVLKFFVTNYLFKKRKRLEGPALWIVDDWSTAYFHWLADALSRLFTIKDRLKDLTLLLPYKYKNLEFVRPTLKAFGVREIEFIESNEVFFCKHLIMPTQTAPSGHYHEETIRAVGKLLSDFYRDTSGVHHADRVYISRSRARKRRILNEAEVIDVLREFGFEVICAEEVSFAQQVKVASAARYLVSNHGAGLTNMLFMSPGSSVLEFRHNTDRINNCYFTLASALNHKYLYQTCVPQNPEEDAHTANLVVDVEALRQNLKLMLQD